MEWGKENLIVENEEKRDEMVGYYWRNISKCIIFNEFETGLFESQRVWWWWRWEFIGKRGNDFFIISSEKV